MAYRYCPDCGEWLETADYTVDEVGWTICKQHRVSTHGYLDGGIRTVRDFNSVNSYGDWSEERAAAKAQGLIR